MKSNDIIDTVVILFLFLWLMLQLIAELVN